MAKILKPSKEWLEWAETHRCAICDALPMLLNTTMVDEFRTLKPEYRSLAAVGTPAESWQTDHIGGEWRTEVECENGHVMSGRHFKFKEEKDG